MGIVFASPIIIVMRSRRINNCGQEFCVFSEQKYYETNSRAVKLQPFNKIIPLINSCWFARNIISAANYHYVHMPSFKTVSSSSPTCTSNLLTGSGTLPLPVEIPIQEITRKQNKVKIIQTLIVISFYVLSEVGRFYNIITG